MKLRIMLLVALLVVLCRPYTTSAHANLVSSEPTANAVVNAAPASVRMHFSEPLEDSSKAQVVDAQGQVVSRGASRVAPDDANGMLVDLPALPNGVYTVQWTTLSAADGHTARGTFAFAVGDAAAANAPLILPPAVPDPLAPPPVESTLLRWLMVLSVIVAGGALLFGREIGQRLLAQDVPLDAQNRYQRWHGRSVMVALVLGLVVALTSLFTLTHGLTLAKLATSRTLLLLSGRVVLVVATLLAAWWSGLHARRMLLPLILGSTLALTISLFGHSAVGSADAHDHSVNVAIALDWLHIATTAAWIGGLLQLAGVFWSLRGVEQAPRLAVLRRVVPQFSALATASIVLLTGTGLYSVWQHFSWVEQLWTTAYGRSLVIKLALFAVLLVLGAINRQKITPQFANEASTAERAARAMRRSINIELGLGVLVLLVVGSLTSLPPARDVPRAQGWTQHVRADNLALTLQVQPEPTGQYVVAVGVDGLPADAENTQVLLRTSMVAHQMAEAQTELKRVEAQRWGARGSYLSMLGTWQWAVIVRTPGHDDVVHTFNVDAAAVDAAMRPPLPLLQRLSLPWYMLGAFGVLGVALLVGAGGAWVANGLPRGRWVRATQLLVFGSFLLCIVPYYLGVATTPRNPYQPTAEILAQGKAIYSQNCVPCHGVQGRGDGPAARSLPVQPANFTLPHFLTHPEPMLFEWVKNGIQGRGMPAWGGKLSDPQIWQVLTYVNELNRQGNTMGQARP